MCALLLILDMAMCSWRSGFGGATRGGEGEHGALVRGKYRANVEDLAVAHVHDAPVRLGLHAGDRAQRDAPGRVGELAVGGEELATADRVDGGRDFGHGRPGLDRRAEVVGERGGRLE